MENSEIIEFEDEMIVCICDKIFYVTGLSIRTQLPTGRKEVSILGTNGLSVSFVCADKELEDLPSMRRLIGRKERKVSYPGEYLGSSTDILVHIGNMVAGDETIKLFRSSVYGTVKSYDWELADSYLVEVPEEEKLLQVTTQIFGDEVCATVVTYGNSKTVKFCIGVSKKSPEDEVDLSTGIRLSVERAINASTRKGGTGVPFVEKAIPGLSKYKKEITEFMQQFSGNLDSFQNTYFPKN